MTTAHELIDSRLIDLLREKEVLDARIAELEQLREQLPAAPEPAAAEEPGEVPAAPPPARRRRGKPEPEPAASNGRDPAADPLAAIARSLAAGPAGSTQAVADLAGVSYPTASKYLRQHGPDAPGREQCFRKGDGGWELTDRGRSTLLKDG